MNDRIVSYKATAIDSTGAGDAFLGGMLAGLHHGLAWGNVLKLANACGAACCEISGATPDLAKSRARVFELYDGPSFDGARKEASAPTVAPTSPYDNAISVFLNTAIEELTKLQAKIGGADYFQRVADFINAAEREGKRVHVTGIGKPEYVSGYIAALLASVGTPTYFLDATECVHGSAGQVVPGDVVIALSSSGETLELKAAILALRHNGAKVIGVSGNPASWLAQQSDEFLYAGVEREGSPLNFEPRASILAQIYVLAGLSIELQARKNISHSEYNAWHPGGSIGKATGKLIPPPKRP